MPGLLQLLNVLVEAVMIQDENTSFPLEGSLELLSVGVKNKGSFDILGHVVANLL